MSSPSEETANEKTTTLIVLGREIGLNAYTQGLFQKLVLAVISTLRAPELEGTEKVRIEVTK